MFFDIDGTLVEQDNRIPQSTIEAVEKLRTNGLQVVSATGRSPVHITNVAETLKIDFYICCNGSIVHYKGDKLYRESIPQETVYQLTENAKEKTIRSLNLQKTTVTRTLKLIMK